MEVSQAVLEHYGVKGMKWGVRKLQGKTSPGKHKSVQKKYEKKLARTAKQVQNRPAATVVIKRPPRGSRKTTITMSGREFTDTLIESYGSTKYRDIRRGEAKRNEQAGVTGPNYKPKVTIRKPRDSDNKARIKEAKRKSYR